LFQNPFNFSGSPHPAMAMQDGLFSFKTETYFYSSAVLLKGYSDDSMFDLQKIYKDIESDFEGVYNKYENKHKNYLSSKKDQLINVADSSETFEKFIAKQNLNFKFKLNIEDFTFYGSSEKIDKFYDTLMSKKSFLIDPKEVFMVFYKKSINDLQLKERDLEFKKGEKKLEKLKEEIKKNQEEKKKSEEKLKEIQQENKKTDKELKNIEMEEIKKKKELEEKQKKLEEEKRKEEEKQKLNKDLREIDEAYDIKLRKINNYFATLKFLQKIPTMDFTLKISGSNSQIRYKEKIEKKLLEDFNEGKLKK